MDDRTLVNLARDGDIDAYCRLIERYQGVALRAAWLITRDASEAEDVVQDACVNAFAALSSLRPDAPFRPWLLRIVTNAALNRQRSRGRQARAMFRAAEEIASTQHAPSPETSVIASEEDEWVDAAVRELPERDRVVIVYHYYLDLSVGEIAAILDCPERTIRSRLRRALARLEQRLTADARPHDSRPAPQPTVEPDHD